MNEATRTISVTRSTTTANFDGQSSVTHECFTLDTRTGLAVTTKTEVKETDNRSGGLGTLNTEVGLATGSEAGLKKISVGLPTEMSGFNAEERLVTGSDAGMERKNPMSLGIAESLFNPAKPNPGGAGGLIDWSEGFLSDHSPAKKGVITGF